MGKTIETSVDHLEQEKFPLKGVPIQVSIVGKEITLNLVHINNPKREENEPEYTVRLSLGENFVQGIGHFNDEANARERYGQCLRALRNGGYISVDIGSLQICNSAGKVIAPVVHYRGTRPEDS